MTASDDISYGGTSFPLRHGHASASPLMSAPLPQLPPLRPRRDLVQSYALIRNSRSTNSGTRVMGVMFLGRVPPKPSKASGSTPPTHRPARSDARFEHLGRGSAAPERLQLFVDLKLKRVGMVGAMGGQSFQGPSAMVRYVLRHLQSPRQAYSSVSTPPSPARRWCAASTSGTTA